MFIFSWLIAMYTYVWCFGDICALFLGHKMVLNLTDAAILIE